MTKKLSDEEKASRQAARLAAAQSKTVAAPATEPAIAATSVATAPVAPSPIVPQVPLKKTHTVTIQGVYVATYNVESGAKLGSVYTPDNSVILRDSNGKEIAADTLIVHDIVLTSAAKSHRG